MRIATVFLGAALICTTSSLVLAKTKAPTLRDQQQAACYNDAQKLCGEFVPDVDKISACMAEKKSQVSKGCRKYMK